MWSDYVIYHANEFCFGAAVVISVLFYRQYKKYEQEAEKKEMLETFLNSHEEVSYQLPSN